MGIFGIFIISGLSGVGVFASTALLRNLAHRGKSRDGTVSTTTSCTSAHETADVTDSSQNTPVHIGTETTALTQARAATVIQSHVAIPIVAAPLKEYTPKASPVTYESQVNPGSYEAFLLPNSAGQVEEWPSDASDTETESFSFVAEAVVSDVPDTAGFDSGEMSMAKTPSPDLGISAGNQTSETRRKAVTFQLDNEEPQDAEFCFHTPDAPRFKRVLPDIDAEKEAETETSPSRDAYDQEDEHEEAPVNVYHASTLSMQASQSAANFPTLSSPSGLPLRSTPAKPQQPSFLSAEPLAQVSALEDVVTAAPIATEPIVEHEESSPTSRFSDTRPTVPRPLHGCSELLQTRSLVLPTAETEGSRTFDDTNKENGQRSSSSTPERVSRKPGRDADRPGIFRRTSQPALKRFRFSERIKMRPLRAARANSK